MKALAITALAAMALATPAVAAYDDIIRRPTTGCTDRAAMVRVRDLRLQRDPAAADALLADGLNSGSCRPFEPGEPVVVEDGDILAGLSKVHTLGDPTPFWVPFRALQR